jgi:3-methyladenine DNA glycosylase AlkD
MNTAKDILEELRPLGSAGYKKVLFNHGVKEPVFGVKISELKKIQKRVKKDYRLALDLYDTGVYDAMYLAGLIADDARMTKKDLERWVKKAGTGPLSGSTVPWVAAGSPRGWELALEWIDSPEAGTAAAGWATLGSLVSIKPDAELDVAALKQLLKRVERTIGEAGDCVRYQMNHFLIAVGCYVAPLTELATTTAEKIGPVEADLGNNACEVPFAPDYIQKVQQRGTVGKKRKSAKC